MYEYGTSRARVYNNATCTGNALLVQVPVRVQQTKGTAIADFKQYAVLVLVRVHMTTTYSVLK